MLHFYRPSRALYKVNRRGTDMGSKSGSKLNIKQCREIMSNQYRSSDNRFDYQPEEVAARLNYLLSSKIAREIDELMDDSYLSVDLSDFPPPIPSDAMVFYDNEDDLPF